MRCAVPARTFSTVLVPSAMANPTTTQPKITKSEVKFRSLWAS